MRVKSIGRRLGERGFPYATKVAGLNCARITRTELYDRAARNGSLIDYGEFESVTVPEPDAFVDELPEMNRWIGTHTISKPFVGVLSDVRLVGSPPLAFSGSKYVADASVSRNVQTLNVINSARETPKRILSGNGRGERLEEAVLLHHSWVDGYFHWVAETLTRLEGVERYAAETGRRPTLIVGPELTSFQRESLALLGYEREDLRNWQTAHCTVDRLVVPSMRREIDPPNPSPFSHRWLRTRLRETALREADTSRFSERVYISRGDAASRRVVNEPEVEARLESYGFDSYRLAEMSVQETIALFAQADCLVAPHGAGLTDLIYTDDAAVLEFMPRDRVNGVYFMLSKQVGDWYGYLACDRPGVDLVVDVDDLESMLEAALDRERPGRIA
ncbi:glycosyltransferase family 61 protein [Halopiger djelfimassiliensis]|uniref:glycosyltransferase family 61 protein n=1 Tax=Halopiger djelfimassiliensis TaxID=1293047 RepID=UPI000677692E|nr:glycosyltransferase family 61 protein [Halopiger djelfimassiliensis]